jgi:ABC-2 type transport system ATP-binding protein
MEEADKLCERVAIIDRGCLLALDAPANLKARAPGGTLVQVTLDGPADDLVAAAAGLPGLLRVEAHGATVHAYGERPAEVITGLLRLAEASQRVVRDIHLTPPSLETLFVAMTGRGLA